MFASPTRVGPGRTAIAAIALFVAAVFSAACAGSGLTTDYDMAQQRIARYLSTHPDLDPATAAAIRRAEVRKGMTAEQVVAAWGPPIEVKRFRSGALQHWFFGCNWPHICNDADEWFPTADEIYQSSVLLENGRVIDFRH